MKIHTHDRVHLTPDRATIECARCGEYLFLPEWSEYLDDARVHHLWTCEACGYSFETTIQFAVA